MRAFVVRDNQPHRLTIAQVPEPTAKANEVIVRVHAFSLNRGEVSRVAAGHPFYPEDTIPGWDVAGVVVAAAKDGTGPAIGAHVAGLARNFGAWAERVALTTDLVVSLPDDVSFERASALPVAGLTALRAVEAGGPLLGRRVLVTGAAGGVGGAAAQLAHLAGAHVTGVVSAPARATGLYALGVDEIVTELSAQGPSFDVLIESAGGASLAAALTRVAPGGTVVSLGNSSGQLTTFDASAFYVRGGATVNALHLLLELDRRASGVRDLGTLLDLMRHNRFDPRIERVSDWRECHSLIDDLMARKLQGKAVLVID